MPLKSSPQEILQLTHTFLKMQVFPALAWPELERSVEHWLSRHDGVQSMVIDVLPALAYGALGGHPKTALPLNSSWVLYLIAARVFDDVQDNEGEGRPWNEFGLSQALPVGVGLMSAAGVCLSDSSFDGNIARALQHMFSMVGVKAAQAQRYERTDTLYNTSLENYFAHIIGTTAQVFALGAQAGGYLYGVEEVWLRALSRYGFNSGMKSAILDDCQDLVGSEYASSDLENGRYRLPVLYALAQPDTHLRSCLQAVLKEIAEGKSSASEAVELLHRMGAITWCLNLAQVYQQKALDSLTLLPKDTQEVLAEYV